VACFKHEGHPSHLIVLLSFLQLPGRNSCTRDALSEVEGQPFVVETRMDPSV